MRRVVRSMFSKGRSATRLAARKAHGMVMLSRYRSAISRTKDCPGSSCMKPSCGIVPVDATAIAAAASTALDCVVQGLVGQIGRVRARTVIVPTLPLDADLLGDETVGLFHARSFNSAEHVEIHGGATPRPASMHTCDARCPAAFLSSAQTRAWVRARPERSGISGGAVYILTPSSPIAASAVRACASSRKASWLTVEPGPSSIMEIP